MIKKVKNAFFNPEYKYKVNLIWSEYSTDSKNWKYTTQRLTVCQQSSFISVNRFLAPFMEGKYTISYIVATL